MAEWYCALFDSTNMRGIKDFSAHIIEVLGRIFGDDLHDVCVIGEKTTKLEFDVLSEGYFFFCCDNYFNHVKLLQKCPEISLVLPSTNSPEPVDYEDIEGFRDSIIDDVSIGLELGDIVFIKNGIYRNLRGIVVSKDDKKEIASVSFSLFVKSFCADIMYSNVEIRDNIFKHGIRFPVVGEEE